MSLIKKLLVLPLVIGLGILFSCGRQAYDHLERVEKYDVVWNSPSHDAWGSMPTGNGDISLNV